MRSVRRHLRSPRPWWLTLSAYALIAVAAAIAAALLADTLGGGALLQSASVLVVVLVVQVIYVALGRRREAQARMGAISRLSTLLALPILALSGALAIGLVDENGNPPRCPEPGHGFFSARTVEVEGHGPDVYEEAMFTSQATRRIPEDCALRFVGYCIGDVHLDQTNREVPDSRWFILPDGGGVIPSGYTQGNPDPSVKPQRCAGGVPPPDSVTVREAALDPGGRYARLRGESKRAAFVGFAIEFAPGRWRRVGWDKGAEDTDPFQAVLVERARSGARIAAVACIAVENPTREVAMTSLDRADVTSVKRDFSVRQPEGTDPAAIGCMAGTKLPQ